MTVGEQLSIFDELGERERGVTCPHCGHTWTLTQAGEPSLASHFEGQSGWPFGASEAGQCTNQQRRLYNVASRVHFPPEDPRHPGTHDVLWAILEAKQHGCTDKQIAAVIKAATPRK